MQMGKVALRRLAVALMFAGLATVSAYSQNIFGSIVGTVDDKSGAVLPNLAITVTNPATGEKRAVTTDNQGNYQVLSLPRGEYSVSRRRLSASSSLCAAATDTPGRRRAMMLK